MSQNKQKTAKVYDLVRLKTTPSRDLTLEEVEILVKYGVRLQGIFDNMPDVPLSVQGPVYPQREDQDLPKKAYLLAGNLRSVTSGEVQFAFCMGDECFTLSVPLVLLGGFERIATTPLDNVVAEVCFVEGVPKEVLSFLRGLTRR